MAVAPAMVVLAALMVALAAVMVCCAATPVWVAAMMVPLAAVCVARAEMMVALAAVCVAPGPPAGDVAAEVAVAGRGVGVEVAGGGPDPPPARAVLVEASTVLFAERVAPDWARAVVVAKMAVERAKMAVAVAGLSGAPPNRDVGVTGAVDEPGLAAVVEPPCCEVAGSVRAGRVPPLLAVADRSVEEAFTSVPESSPESANAIAPAASARTPTVPKAKSFRRLAGPPFAGWVLEAGCVTATGGCGRAEPVEIRAPQVSQKTAFETTMGWPLGHAAGSPQVSQKRPRARSTSWPAGHRGALSIFPARGAL